jgi:peptidoglycan hydrolase CwlO-like protein
MPKFQSRVEGNNVLETEHVAYTGDPKKQQLMQAAIGGSDAKRSRIEFVSNSEQFEKKISLLKSHIKYLENKINHMGKEIDAKDDVLADLREEAELNAKEVNRLKSEQATAREERIELQIEIRCWKTTSNNAIAALAAIKEMILKHGVSLEDNRT